MAASPHARGDGTELRLQGEKLSEQVLARARGRNEPLW
jgi:hypothetical protein